MSATVTCSLCGRPTTEYCSTLACRACHKSITFEDCVNGTTPEEVAWNKRKAAELAKLDPGKAVRP